MKQISISHSGLGLGTQAFLNIQRAHEVLPNYNNFEDLTSQDLESTQGQGSSTSRNGDQWI